MSQNPKGGAADSSVVVWIVFAEVTWHHLNFTVASVASRAIAIGMHHEDVHSKSLNIKAPTRHVLRSSIQRYNGTGVANAGSASF